MLSRWVRQTVMVAVASSSSLVAGVWAQTQTTPDPAQSKAHSNKVDPQINAQFQKGSVKDFIKRFESNDREVFVQATRRPGSFVSRQRRRRTRLGGTAVLVPDLDKSLGFRITPGQAGPFQIVGASAPQLTPLKGPTCHYAAIGKWVENRSSCPYTR